ncbi:GlsB/YeaQ/YmgE family stress response membrane protein [Demequina globuliformis]|uniref:GlsB/YeaQ/YmgE family stress response membrane protein n=1 Tax=Demequina globuliformis TaxID=676202 RepID=UPI0007864393|nr:hypothetical protein [Demequina globuliformis]
MTEHTSPENDRVPESAREDAVPAQFRLAPRFGRVVGTGVVLGFIAGALASLILPNTTGVGTFTVALLVGAGFALLGAVIAGLIAVSLDRGTASRHKAAKQAHGTEGSSGADAATGDA